MSDLYRPKLTQLPPDMLTLADYERRAPDFMPHPIFEYIDGGCGDDLTRNSNSSSFDRWQILPQTLQNFSRATTATRWFGQTLPHPIALAPVAYQRLVHPQGELASAQAADALGALYCTSTLSSVTLEEIAPQLQQRWFQLYWQGSREQSLSLVRRAEASGYQAIIVTVDVPVNGLRQRPQRAGFHLPDSVRAVNLDGIATPGAHTLNPGQSVILHGIMSAAPDWDDILWLRQQTQLPLLLKGVLNPQDAARARDAGIDGLIVSNHGGRSLDGVASPMQMLAAIRQQCGAEMLLLLDSGVRRGTDVFKALALGANGVLIGRPLLYGLAIAGALGVAHTLKLLLEELEMTMALAGCPTLADIGPERLIQTF